jgi:diphthine synthase
MVFYIIGLGLGDHRDITVRGLECVKNCDKLYLEYYTSVLGVDKQKLEEFYGKTIELADREFVESHAEDIYQQCREEGLNIALLVVGDPLCATTHVDIILRAKKEGIPVEVVHNASVMGAVASCGLQLYQFGYTVSIPWFEGDIRPSSYYERISYNAKGGMHTLCLLDIKVKEPDYEAMVKYGKIKFLPPRFMTVSFM